jgi:hypothetical protein
VAKFAVAVVVFNQDTEEAVGEILVLSDVVMTPPYAGASRASALAALGFARANCKLIDGLNLVNALTRATGLEPR